MPLVTVPARASSATDGVRVFGQFDYLVFVLLSCSTAAMIVYFFLDWFSPENWLSHPISFSILTFIIVARVANSQIRWFSLPYMKRPQRAAPARGLKVAVVTTIVPSAESLEMLEETVTAMVAMDYPHETWVLDEDDSDAVKAICRRTGAHHFSRKNLPHYLAQSGPFQIRSKHGNYNAWLHEVGFDRYEILAAFDPDHVPSSNFLSNVIGYFEESSAVG